jgi:pyridoxal 5'-phosphate synthase pdxS subunit
VTEENFSSVKVNREFVKILKDGVIMGVASIERARVAGEAVTVTIIVLERIPSDIMAQGGVTKIADPRLIKAIMSAVSIPVMAKVRIGDFVEAQLLEAIDGDFIDESEVLTPANEIHYINKWSFRHKVVEVEVLKQNNIVDSTRDNVARIAPYFLTTHEDLKSI